MRHFIRAASAALVFTFFFQTTPAFASNQRITTVPLSMVLRAVSFAHTITVSAFTISPRGPMMGALVSAAASGAHITIILDRDAFGGALRMNEETTDRAQRSGIRVLQSGDALHIKIALVDGAAFVSDRNWTRDGLIFADPLPADRDLLTAALQGRTGQNGHLWTRKADALRAEAALLAMRAGRMVFVSTESFNAYTPVYRELLTRAGEGDQVYLLVTQTEYNEDSRDRAAVATLSRDGVHVHISTSDDKFAVDGTHVWAGSANLTSGLPNQIDFGLTLSDGTIATQLRNVFQAEWAQSDAP